MAIEKRRDGILVGGRLYTWAELDVIPNTEVKRKIDAATASSADDAEWDAVVAEEEARKRRQLDRLTKASRIGSGWTKSKDGMWSFTPPGGVE